MSHGRCELVVMTTLIPRQPSDLAPVIHRTGRELTEAQTTTLAVLMHQANGDPSSWRSWRSLMISADRLSDVLCLCGHGFVEVRLAGEGREWRWSPALVDAAVWARIPVIDDWAQRDGAEYLVLTAVAWLRTRDRTDRLRRYDIEVLAGGEGRQLGRAAAQLGKQGFLRADGRLATGPEWITIAVLYQRLETAGLAEAA